MDHLIKSLVLFCVIALFIPVSVQGKHFSIGSGIGFAYPMGDLEDYVDLGLTLHGFAQWHLNEYIGIRSMINYQYLSGDDSYFVHSDFFNVETDLQMWDVQLDAVATWNITDQFFVSGMAGMGIYLWEADIEGIFLDYEKDDTNLGFNVGGNLGYNVFANVSLQATMIQHYVDFDNWIGSSSWTDFLVTLMVSF
jgi:opacity protein-like surface antigen